MFCVSSGLWYWLCMVYISASGKVMHYTVIYVRFFVWFHIHRRYSLIGSFPRKFHLRNFKSGSCAMAKHVHPWIEKCENLRNISPVKLKHIQYILGMHIRTYIRTYQKSTALWNCQVVERGEWLALSSTWSQIKLPMHTYMIGTFWPKSKSFHKFKVEGWFQMHIHIHSTQESLV